MELTTEDYLGITVGVLFMLMVVGIVIWAIRMIYLDGWGDDKGVPIMDNPPPPPGLLLKADNEPKPPKNQGRSINN